jgi:1-phosphatidylinositol-3-phosphate 5-kinase
MATHKAKALPPLPQASLTTLSTDARIHRAALIRHLLTDVPDNSIPRRLRHACVMAIQDALDWLSDALVEGEWLAGIRRSKPGARTAPEDSILVQLRDCLARPASVASLDCHLLLCLAPPAQDQALGIACSFTAGKFILPSDANQIETSVLYGLRECRDRR